MMRSVPLRTLYEKRGFILGWTIGLAAFSALMAVFYPAMRPEGGMEELLANMPVAFQGLVGDMAALNSFDTYLATQLFDIRGSIIIGIMAVILGVGLSTRDEESGELRTLLAQPISRTRLHLENWLAMVVIITITTAIGIGGGIYLTMPFIDGASLALDTAIRLTGMTILVMTAFATVSYAAGTFTGKKSAATLVGTIVLTLSFIISTFSVGVEWLRDFEQLSLLHYFPALEIARDGIAWTDVAVLGGVTVGLVVLSLLVFQRRDIA